MKADTQVMTNSSGGPCEVAESSPSSAPGAGRLKLFFVGDNRNGANWGRGASIALAQLLSGPFEIHGRVSGEMFDSSKAEAAIVGTIAPARYYSHFRYLHERRDRWPFRWYVRLEELFGARDFVAEDPEASVDNLLAYKGRHPALARIYEQAEQADIIVLDGDGDIVFSTPPRRQTLFLLAMMALGLRLKKPVFLVNSMISDCPSTGRNPKTVSAAKRLFAQCRGLALRDQESLEYVRKEIPEANATLIPDSLFAWQPLFADEKSAPPLNGNFLLPFPEREEFWDKLDFSKPYICIGGGALAGTQHSRALASYGRLIDQLRPLGCNIYLTENDIPDSFLRQVASEKNLGIVPVDSPILQCGATLAHARLFISGRYHPSIFASLGGTPCIFLATHAHKMASLPHLLEYESDRCFSAFPGDSEIQAILALSKQYLAQGESLRAKIRQAARARCAEVSQLPGFLHRHLERRAL